MNFQICIKIDFLKLYLNHELNSFTAFKLRFPVFKFTIHFCLSKYFKKVFILKKYSLIFVQTNQLASDVISKIKTRLENNRCFLFYHRNHRMGVIQKNVYRILILDS